MLRRTNLFAFISVEGIETSTLREYLDTCVQFEGAPSESEFKIKFMIESLLPPLQTAEHRNGKGSACVSPYNLVGLQSSPLVRSAVLTKKN